MDEELPQAVHDDLKKINTEAQRAARVVQNLLSFSRRHESQKNYVDVTESVQSALELKAYEFAVNDIHVTTEFAEALPRTMVDEHQLAQVVLNILTNAQQAMAGARRGGRLTINTGTVGDRVRISISDDGPGIESEHLKKIFDPFFTTKEVGRGTGLGLSICYGIVRQHGGELWAANNPDKGATFHIELPIVAQEGGKDPHTERPRKAVGSRQHILVVDDEPGIRELLTRIMSSEGHDVDLASDGDEGWRKLQTRSYDHILLDLKMPGMDGRQLYRLIESLNGDLSSRVVFITGDTLTPETRDFVVSAGNPTLIKPFTRDELRRVILNSGGSR